MKSSICVMFMAAVCMMATSSAVAQNTPTVVIEMTEADVVPSLELPKSLLYAKPSAMNDPQSRFASLAAAVALSAACVFAGLHFAGRRLRTKPLMLAVLATGAVGCVATVVYANAGPPRQPQQYTPVSAPADLRLSGSDNAKIVLPRKLATLLILSAGNSRAAARAAATTRPNLALPTDKTGNSKVVVGVAPAGSSTTIEVPRKLITALAGAAVAVADVPPRGNGPTSAPDREPAPQQDRQPGAPPRVSGPVVIRAIEQGDEIRLLMPQNLLNALMTQTP